MDSLELVGCAAKGVAENATNPYTSPVRGSLKSQRGAVGDGTKAVDGEVKMPPAENSQKTQIATTLPTYKKADELLKDSGDGKTLDYGAGLGLSQKMGYDTLEPFPREGFTPTHVDSANIPDESYSKITNLNVLNVVPPEVRDGIVTDIGRILKPNGLAVITTRGRDVMSAKGVKGSEPMSIITSNDTYQKGFTQGELRKYLQDTLGEGFMVTTRQKMGAAGAVVRKINEPEGVDTLLNRALGDQPRKVASTDAVKYKMVRELANGDGFSGVGGLCHKEVCKRFMDLEAPEGTKFILLGGKGVAHSIAVDSNYKILVDSGNGKFDGNIWMPPKSRSTKPMYVVEELEAQPVLEAARRFKEGNK